MALLLQIILEKPGLTRAEYLHLALARGVKRGSFYNYLKDLVKAGKIKIANTPSGVRIYPGGAAEFADPSYADQLIGKVRDKGYATEIRRSTLHELLSLARTRTILVSPELILLLGEALDTPKDPSRRPDREDPEGPLGQEVLKLLPQLVEKFATGNQKDAFDRPAELKRLWQGIGEKLLKAVQTEPSQATWAFDVLIKFGNLAGEPSMLTNLALQVTFDEKVTPALSGTLEPAVLRLLRNSMGADRKEVLRVKQRLEEAMKGGEDDVRRRDRVDKARRLWSGLTDVFLKSSG